MTLVSNGYTHQFNPTKAKAEVPAILNSLRLPGRINAEPTAALLGFAAWDIPLLVKAKLLKPLGNGDAKNCVKYFASVDIVELANNPKWLEAATKAICRRTSSGQPRSKASRPLKPNSDAEQQHGS